MLASIANLRRSVSLTFSLYASDPSSLDGKSRNPLARVRPIEIELPFSSSRTTAQCDPWLISAVTREPPAFEIKLFL